MLADEKIMGFSATVDPARARAFYEGVLGLRLLSDEPHALVFDANGTMLRVQKVRTLTPPGHTVLGWEVRDIVATVRDLTARGVEMLRVSITGQDELGIWHTPSGATVAWFKDPDGNTLSVAQH